MFTLSSINNYEFPVAHEQRKGEQNKTVMGWQLSELIGKVHIFSRPPENLGSSPQTVHWALASSFLWEPTQSVPLYKHATLPTWNWGKSLPPATREGTSQLWQAALSQTQKLASTRLPPGSRPPVGGGGHLFLKEAFPGKGAELC